MGRYRARDLVNVPTLVSWLRLPLAVAFPFTLGMPAVCLGVLAAAALSDVLDGWIARRYALATATGAEVDGVTDKGLAVVVLVSLVVTHAFSLGDVALLFVRELLEIPLVLWVALSRRARSRKIDERANILGKAATTLQFLSVGAALIHAGWVRAPIVATALVGLGAAISYWNRMLQTPAARS